MLTEGNNLMQEFVNLEWAELAQKPSNLTARTTTVL